MASNVKHHRTTLERIEKALSSQFFADVNIFSRLYEKLQLPGLEIFKWTGEIDQQPGSKPDCDPANFVAVKLGDSFGPTWTVHWFKIVATIPGAVQGKELHLRWDSSSECMLYDSRLQPVQGLSGSPGHQRRCEYVISRSWDRAQGDQQTFYVEMQCCDMFGAGGGGMIEPPDETKMYQIQLAEIAVFNREMYNLYRDLELLYDYAKAYGNEDGADDRGYQALYAGNEMLNKIHAGAIAEAQTIADLFFSEGNGRKAHTIHAVGHCHIDSAWLWDYDVSKRKCARSWISTLKLMEEYPDFTFACSQAQQFQWVKDLYPEIYEKIKLYVAQGRFIPVGGTWVEMDGNIPSGESFLRQFLYGQKFFENEFGMKCKEFWLPDTFGYSAQIPQILQHVGIERFLTQKLSWSLVNKFPHHNFYWEGIDGSEVLVHFPPGDSYEANCRVAEAVKTIRNLKDKGRVRQSMMLFGYGDGGGGPTRQMIERLNRLADVDGVPKMISSTPDIFFTELEKDGSKLCRWRGELYLELHNGTYTSQAAMKELNRRCEAELQKAEFLVAMSLLVKSVDKDKAKKLCDVLEGAWKDVLLNQFHDVLPGSSIKKAHDDAEALFRKSLNACEDVITQCLKSFQEAEKSTFVSVNSLQWDRMLTVKEGQLSAPGFGLVFGIQSQPPTTTEVASKPRGTFVSNRDRSARGRGTYHAERLVLSTLNKLTESNFTKLAERLAQQVPDETPLLARIIHKKALADTVFRKLYARLVAYLDERRPKSSSLKRELATVVWSFFEDRVKITQKIDGFQGTQVRCDELMQLSNMNFMCELFLEHVVSAQMITSVLAEVSKLGREGNQLSLELACSVLTSVGGKLTSDVNQSDCHQRLQEAATQAVAQTVEGLREVASRRKLTKRIEFLLLDVLELEANNWLPREERENLETTVKFRHSITIKTETREDASEAVSVKEEDGYFAVQNKFFRAKIDHLGRVRSLVQRSTSFDYVIDQKPMNQLVMFEDIPLFWDAWDCMDYHLETRRPINTEGNKITPARVVESSKSRVVIRWSMMLNEDTDRESSLTQDIIVEDNCEIIDFITEVDWHESRRFMKVEFPSVLNVDEAVYEIQHGLLKRPTHVNTSWDWARFEVCGHRWAALAEPDCGFAVLNDSKYGWSARKGTLCLSLLRSPKSPDKYCDMRKHVFRYALMPFTGPLQGSRVVQRAREYNSSLAQLNLSRSGEIHRESTKTRQWFSLCSSLPVTTVVLDTVKVAETTRVDKGDGVSVVIRLYEAVGTRQTVRIYTTLPFAFYRPCNGLEEPLEEEKPLSEEGELRFLEFRVKPFQIRSFLLS